MILTNLRKSYNIPLKYSELRSGVILEACFLGKFVVEYKYNKLVRTKARVAESAKTTYSTDLTFGEVFLCLKVKLSH